MNAEDRGWPTWEAPAADGGFIDGYGGVSKYVKPELIEQSYAHIFSPGKRARMRRRDEFAEDLDRRIVAEIWRELSERKASYLPPPWLPGKGQRIRHAGWILRTNGGGTCIDFAVLFAAACLAESIPVSLVMLRGDKAGHVGIAVHLGRTTKPGDASVAATTADSSRNLGVVSVTDRERLIKDQDLLLIETTGAASSDGSSLAQSTAALAETIQDVLRFPECHLVDVAARHEMGDEPWDFVPALQGALLGEMAPVSVTTTFSAHTAIRESIAKIDGRVVICGPSAVGKSTLARDIASKWDNGFGWFLSAPSEKALVASMAEHELRERSLDLRVLEQIERDSLGTEAKRRLEDHEGYWVVVADNVDGKPEHLQKSLPQDLSEGQLLIVTSTLPKIVWEAAGYKAFDLDYVDDSEIRSVARELGLPQDLVFALSGTPLLLTAYLGLIEAHPDRLPEIVTAANSAESGAAGFWAALSVLMPDHVGVARLAAWMPAERIGQSSSNATQQTFNDPEISKLNDLVHAGLLTQTQPGVFFMHRIFSKAIRDSTPADKGTSTAQRLMSNPATVQTFLRFGGGEVLKELQAALEASADGLALAGLATVEEMYEGETSTLTFERAMDLLDSSSDERSTALADCLHAQARVINQLPSASAEQIKLALEQIRQAILIRPESDPVGRAKHEALEALLRQRSTRNWAIDDPNLVPELMNVRSALDASYVLRRDHLGEADPLVDRALFNKAGVCIRLAQLDAANREEYLADALRIYTTTQEFRRSFYSSPSPLEASSTAGIATWAYFSALYGSDSATLSNLLDIGFETAHDALKTRRQMPNKGDIGKSAAIVAKLAVLQSHLLSQKPVGAIREILDELQLERALLGL